jgi:hypothetical protein
MSEVFGAIRGLVPFPRRGHRRPDLTSRPLRFILVPDRLRAGGEAFVDRGGDARTPQPPRYGCDPERQRVICRRLTRSDPEDDGRTRFLKPEPFAASDGILQPTANPPPTSQGRSVRAAFRHRARLYIAVPIPPTSPVPLCQLTTNCRVELPCPQAFFLELQLRDGLRSCAIARSHYVHRSAIAQCHPAQRQPRIES